jgi:hypothetical protein
MVMAQKMAQMILPPSPKQQGFSELGHGVERTMDKLSVTFTSKMATAKTSKEFKVAEGGVHEFQVRVHDIGSVAAVGLCDAKQQVHVGCPGETRLSWAFCSDGDLLVQGVSSEHHKEWEEGDSIKIQYDADEGTMTAWRNGKQMGPQVPVDTTASPFGNLVLDSDSDDEECTEQEEKKLCFCVGGSKGTEIEMERTGPSEKPKSNSDVQRKRTDSFAAESPSLAGRCLMRVTKVSDTPQYVRNTLAERRSMRRNPSEL